MVSHDSFLFMLDNETSTRETNSMPFLLFQRRDYLRSAIESGASQPSKCLGKNIEAMVYT